MMAIISQCPNCGRDCCNHHKPYCNGCVDDYIKNLKDALENIAARHKNCNDSCPVKKITEQALADKPESEADNDDD